MTLAINEIVENTAKLRLLAQRFKYKPGEYHTFLGKKYQLSIKLGKANSIVLKKRTMVVTCSHKPTPHRVKRILHDWYLEQAKIIFEKMMHDCWKKFRYHGVKMPRLRLRKMKTCWATISLVSHAITLNSELIKAPRQCIRYVVIHEFCHLKSIYHDKTFYAFLRKKDPHWRKHRAILDHLQI